MSKCQIQEATHIQKVNYPILKEGELRDLIFKLEFLILADSLFLQLPTPLET